MKRLSLALACLLALGTTASAHAQTQTPVKQEACKKNDCKHKSAKQTKTCTCQGKCACATSDKSCGCQGKSCSCSADTAKQGKSTCKSCQAGKSCAHCSKEAADTTKQGCCKKK